MNNLSLVNFAGSIIFACVAMLIFAFDGEHLVGYAACSAWLSCYAAHAYHALKEKHTALGVIGSLALVVTIAIILTVAANG